MADQNQKRDKTLVTFAHYYSKKPNEVTPENRTGIEPLPSVSQKELDQIKLDGEEHRKRLLEAVAKNYKAAKSLIEGDKSSFRLIAA